jgi:hypothetical protein
MAAVLLGEGQPEQAELAHLLDDLVRERVVLVVLGDHRRDDVVGELLDRGAQRLVVGATSRVAEHDEPADQLSALIDFHTDFALTEPELIAVQFRDLGSAPERERRQVRALQRQYVGIWVEVLQAVYAGVSEQRARTSAQAVFGLLNSTPYSGRAGEPRMDDLLRGMAAAALAAGCTTS